MIVVTTGESVVSATEVLFASSAVAVTQLFLTLLRLAAFQQM